MNNRNYNYTEILENNKSDSQETTNNSFGDKEAKELLYYYNDMLSKVKYLH